MNSFTIYIHVLECLATEAEGMTNKEIASLSGNEYSTSKVSIALKTLKREGYVTVDKSGKVAYWQITEKADEYCSMIARKYAASHCADELSSKVVRS